MARRSRGSAKKLCFTSLRQVIERELANWEGPPFFHIKSFTKHIAPMYWQQATTNGHYKVQNNYGTKTKSGPHLIVNRLTNPTARIVRSLGCKHLCYGRVYQRQDRFGYRIYKGKWIWLLPNTELPPSSYGAFTRHVNLNQEEE